MFDGSFPQCASSSWPPGGRFPDGWSPHPPLIQAEVLLSCALCQHQPVSAHWVLPLSHQPGGEQEEGETSGQGKRHSKDPSQPLKNTHEKFFPKCYKLRLSHVQYFYQNEQLGNEFYKFFTHMKQGRPIVLASFSYPSSCDNSVTL